MNEQQHAEDHWIGSWFASQTYEDRTVAEERFEDQTLRMIVHPHAFGSKLRLRFSNLYGSEPVHFGKVAAALSEEDGLIVPGTCRHVTLHGHTTITIPAGEEIYTDPIDLQLHENTDVAISIYIPASTRTSTWHFSPPSITYVAEGNRTDDRDTGHFRNKIHSYYWLSGLEVLTYGDPFRVIVALGDSITEGSTSTPGTNRRWPEFFQERLDREHMAHPVSVLNAGIVGNQILTNGPDAGMPLGGECILSRLERDVFSHYGVTDVIFLAGINDIGIGNASANAIIAGMKETAARVHEKGLRIFAGTLPPFGNAPYYTNEKEIIRQEVNRWILANEGFDGIIDFNEGLADPQHPEQLLPAYDFGDHLHPNDKGFKALADCIPLSLFGINPNHIYKGDVCMSTMEQKNVETVTAFIEDVANQHVLEKTDQFFVPQMIEAFTDRCFTVDEILVQGEKVIARMFMTAVHASHFAGNPPTGKTVKATQFREFRVIDGKIIEHHGWFDTATLLPQIKA